MIELERAWISPLPFFLVRKDGKLGVVLSVLVKSDDGLCDARILLTMTRQVGVAPGASFVVGPGQLGIAATMVAVTLGARRDLRGDLRLVMARAYVALLAIGIAAPCRALLGNRS